MQANLPNKRYDDEIPCLRSRFVELYQKLCNMRDTESVVLNDLFIRNFGQLRIDVSILEGEVRALKMKTEMMQAAINRSENADIAYIERFVADKFDAFFQKMKEQAQVLKDLKPNSFLDEADAKKLHELHKTLVKRLHPDLHPNQTEKEKDLFLKVQSAYDLCDLQALQMIMISLDLDKDPELDAHLSEKAVEDYKRKLENQIVNIEKQIAELNAKYPFSYRDKLSNEEWIRQEKTVLQNRITDLSAAKQKLEERYQLQKEYFKGDLY